MIIAATGHRPDKLGGYGEDIQIALQELAFEYLTEVKPTKVITGMALGWDQAVALAAVQAGIPFIAAIPFEGQFSNWPIESQERYLAILPLAEEVEIISSGGYAGWKMHRRNEMMVDASDRIMALWNGSYVGGTCTCVAYAIRQKKDIDNLWSKWVEKSSTMPLLASYKPVQTF